MHVDTTTTHDLVNTYMLTCIHFASRVKAKHFHVLPATFALAPIHMTAWLFVLKVMGCHELFTKIVSYNPGSLLEKFLVGVLLPNLVYLFSLVVFR